MPYGHWGGSCSARHQQAGAAPPWACAGGWARLHQLDPCRFLRSDAPGRWHGCVCSEGLCSVGPRGAAAAAQVPCDGAPCPPRLPSTRRALLPWGGAGEGVIAAYYQIRGECCSGARAAAAMQRQGEKKTETALPPAAEPATSTPVLAALPHPRRLAHDAGIIGAGRLPQESARHEGASHSTHGEGQTRRRRRRRANVLPCVATCPPGCWAGPILLSVPAAANLPPPHMQVRILRDMAAKGEVRLRLGAAQFLDDALADGAQVGRANWVAVGARGVGMSARAVACQGAGRGQPRARQRGALWAPQTLLPCRRRHAHAAGGGGGGHGVCA